MIALLGFHEKSNFREWGQHEIFLPLLTINLPKQAQWPWPHSVNLCFLSCASAYISCKSTIQLCRPARTMVPLIQKKTVLFKLHITVCCSMGPFECFCRLLDSLSLSKCYSVFFHHTIFPALCVPFINKTFAKRLPQWHCHYESFGKSFDRHIQFSLLRSFI